MNSLLEIEDLSVTFRPAGSEPVPAVVSSSLRIDRGEILGLVGESGCGKSVTALSITDLLPNHAGTDGRIRLNGTDYELPDDSRANLRGNTVGMVFQDPSRALNPLYTIGQQLRETIGVLKPELSGSERSDRCFELLDHVGMDDPRRRSEQYAHELSGGLRQRATIALALAGSPDLIIADEPTSALDVTLEHQIMKLFEQLAEEGIGVLLISHDLPLVAEHSDRINVMYSGFTVETGPADVMSTEPQHPYTRGLVGSSKALVEGRGERLPEIPGEVPSPEERPPGCPFHPRCGEAEERCREEFPPTYSLGSSLKTACWAREPAN